MKAKKQARRDAKQLFRACVSNGLLDEDRARLVAQRVSQTSNRNRLAVLALFRRLVKLDAAKHAAAVRSATPLPPPLRQRVQDRLTEVYGPGLRTSFAEEPALIGGMRVKVGSDVYDGSVRGRLADLAASLGVVIGQGDAVTR